MEQLSLECPICDQDHAESECPVSVPPDPRRNWRTDEVAWEDFVALEWPELGAGS